MTGIIDFVFRSLCDSFSIFNYSKDTEHEILQLSEKYKIMKTMKNFKRPFVLHFYFHLSLRIIFISFFIVFILRALLKIIFDGRGSIPSLIVVLLLTIIPRVHVGYEMIDN